MTKLAPGQEKKAYTFSPGEGLTPIYVDPAAPMREHPEFQKVLVETVRKFEGSTQTSGASIKSKVPSKPQQKEANFGYDPELAMTVPGYRDLQRTANRGQTSVLGRGIGGSFLGSLVAPGIGMPVGAGLGVLSGVLQNYKTEKAKQKLEDLLIAKMHRDQVNREMQMRLLAMQHAQPPQQVEAPPQDKTASLEDVNDETLLKVAGMKSEGMSSVVNPLNWILGYPSLMAGAYLADPMKDGEAEGMNADMWKNLLIPAMGPYRMGRRLQTSLHAPVTNPKLDKKKEKEEKADD